MRGKDRGCEDAKVMSAAPQNQISDLGDRARILGKIFR